MMETTITTNDAVMFAEWAKGLGMTSAAALVHYAKQPMAEKIPPAWQFWKRRYRKGLQLAESWRSGIRTLATFLEKEASK